MTVYQAAVAAVAEASDRRLAAQVYRYVYGFNPGVLLDEVTLFVSAEMVAA